MKIKPNRDHTYLLGNIIFRGQNTILKSNREFKFTPCLFLGWKLITMSYFIYLFFTMSHESWLLPDTLAVFLQCVTEQSILRVRHMWFLIIEYDSAIIFLSSCIQVKVRMHILRTKTVARICLGNRIFSILRCCS